MLEMNDYLIYYIKNIRIMLPSFMGKTFTPKFT